MGSTERLPSFKGPRDLSLSNRGNKSSNAGSSQSQQAARPRRVYTPNIPPKRERGSTTASTSTPAPSTASSSKSTDAPPSSGRARGRGRSERGSGRGRGGPSRGRGRGRPELHQEASIFSGGVGDPSDGRRVSTQHRSGYEGGRYRTSGAEGRSRMANMNRNTLNTLIKQEEDDESSAKIFGDEKFDTGDTEDTSPENPNLPVILPLLNYVPHLFAPPSPASLDNPIKTEVESERINDPQVPLQPVSLIQIKQELPEDDEISGSISPTPSTSLAQIKQEKIDESVSSDVNGSNKHAFMTMPLEPTSFAGTLRSVDKHGTLAFFQFPDELPVLKGNQKEAPDQPSTSGSTLEPKAELVNDMNELPEGLIGRFQVLSTGKTRFILGDNVFDVDPGRPVGFLQELCCVDLDRNTLTNLGAVDKKFVVSPDLRGLLNDA